MTIKAITFDLDDTFWEGSPVIARAEQRVHRWLAANYPRIVQAFSVEALRRLRQQVAAARPEWAHDVSQLRKVSLRWAAARAGYDEGPVAERAFAVFMDARHGVTFFDDVVPVLQRLSQRYALGALSNGNADIRRLGLEHLFQFALSPEQVGKAKPHGAMFAAACSRFDAQPDQVVHVGDHPEHDICGAAAAGLRTVWLNRGGEAWPGGPPPDAEIETLADLEPVLLQW